MIAHLQHYAPEVFAVKTRGGTFSCTSPFVQRFLKNHLGWVLRKTTRAAQKTPVNAEDQCKASFCRQAISIRNYHIPACLRVNIDQSQVLLNDAGDRTYEVVGSRQVDGAGKEEKRAFTVLMGVSANGNVLPFQVIWKGKTAGSLPPSTSPFYDEAVAIGITFVPSQTPTYWSTFLTMISYIEITLIPFYNRHKAELGLPKDQEVILQLDVWSVHRSKQFRDHISRVWPEIILDYVPGGCTGIWQPCDVGMQRLMKVVIRRSQQEDIIEETLLQIQAGVPPHQIKLDTSVVTLRRRSVRWMVNAYNSINDPTIVKRVSTAVL
ncbi:hypothetical protein BDW22DRAFT_1436148 [Trametopsis cervina]|nr:hypothetical protein BDW22DRAFT_1436148 [Trametopsis cervina]